MTGENISSWEIEHQLDQHPAVLESAVFGVPSELGEDEVMAVVVLRPGATLKPGQLIEFAEDRMAAFMIPDTWSSAPPCPRPRRTGSAKST